jgi:hypothetical protein
VSLPKSNSLGDSKDNPVWTLSMTAAWIMDRSPDAVANAKAAKLDLRAIFGQPKKVADPFDTAPSFNGAEQLLYALRAGHLQATGSLGQENNVTVPSDKWRLGPPEGPSVIRAEKISTIKDEDDDDDFVVEMYRDILVRRDDVFSVWAPLGRPITQRHGRVLPLSSTLPSGFNNLRWTLEHVLAWTLYRDLKQLRALESSDEDRPPWYRMVYRSGFVDDAAERSVWLRLVSGELVGRKKSMWISSDWWRDKKPWDAEEAWFAPELVMSLWPPENSVNANLQNRIMPGRTRGPKPETLERVVKDMIRNLEDNIITIAALQERKQVALAKEYGAARSTVMKAIPIAVSKFQSQQSSAKNK